MNQRIDERVGEGIKERFDEGIGERVGKGIKGRIDEGIGERVGEGIEKRIDEGNSERVGEGRDEVVRCLCACTDESGEMVCSDVCVGWSDLKCIGTKEGVGVMEGKEFVCYFCISA